MLRVFGVPFHRKNWYGDFEQMVRQDAWNDAILVFNDNVHDANQTTPHDGAGTAAIRTFSTKYKPEGEHPRAIGIPTGWSVASGGFTVDADGNAEPFANRAITLAIERLVLTCLAHPEIKRIVFSADPSDPTHKRLGTGIFTLPTQILDFIEERLQGVPNRVAQGDCKFTLHRIDELETQISAVAALHRELAVLKRGVKRPLETAPTMSAQDRERQALLVSKKKLEPSKMLDHGVVYVGPLTGGEKHVYEKIRPNTPPVLKQSTLGRFVQ